MKIKLALGIVALTLSLAGAAPGQESRREAAAPRLTLAETEFDFGEVKAGADAKHSFVVKNEGTADLIIHNVTPSCGCTATDFTRVIPPGREGLVTLLFKTAGYSGALTKTASVFTNDPQRPNFNLGLALVVTGEAPRGRRVGPFVVGPTDHWTGRVARGTSLSAVITVFPDGSDGPDGPRPARVTKLIAGGEVFDVTLETLRGGQSYVVKAVSRATLPIGTHTQVARLVTDSLEHPELALTLEAVVLPPVTVTPAALSFEDMPVSRPDYDVATLSKFVWVRHGVGGGLELKKLSSTLPFIKVKIESVSGGGQAHLLRVGFTDKPAPGRHAGALRIETNNQEVPVIEIPLTVTAK